MGHYQTILVGIDGSETAMRAVDAAAAIAHDSHAELVIVSAYEPASASDEAAAAAALKHDAYLAVGSSPAESTLGDAAGRARSGGATRVETLAVRGTPVAVLDAVAGDVGADFVVVGSVNLNTLTGRILGSVPQGVARRSKVDVLIVHTS